MIFNDMTSQYFDWLRETVCGRWEPRNLSFHKLLAFLFQQDFIPSCEMDASRAEDGRDLRYRFAQEKSIPYHQIYRMVLAFDLHGIWLR